MKKVTVILAVVLCVFTACREEEVLEDGVMRPKDFFSEIMITQNDLKEGWWKFSTTVVREDGNGNYKFTEDDFFDNYPVGGDGRIHFREFIYYIQDGKIIDAKKRITSYDDWVENEELVHPVDILINKDDRSILCPINKDFINYNSRIIKFEKKSILTLTNYVLGTDETNNRTYYLCLRLYRLSKDLPPKKNIRYTEDGVPIYG